MLSNIDEVRAAIAEVAGIATRTLSVFTHDLEPEIYDHDDFLEVAKRFILSRSFARVRVLIADPMRAVKNGNRFVAMGRRLNSYIEFRNVREEFGDHPEAYCIADQTALVYRLQTSKWEGISDTYEPPVAKKYLETFDQIWAACEIEPELRRLHV